MEILDTLFDFSMPAKEKLAKLHDNYGIRLTGSIEKETDFMGNLAQGVFDYGMQQGSIRTTLIYIKNITKKLGMTNEQAMDVLDIPENERQKFMDMLKNKDGETAQ